MGVYSRLIMVALMWGCFCAHSPRAAWAADSVLATHPISLGAFQPTDVVEPASSETLPRHFGAHDRLWVINSRDLSADTKTVNLSLPKLTVTRVNFDAKERESSLKEYLTTILSSPRVVLYVHGNRMMPHEAVYRSIAVHQHVRQHTGDQPIDWVIWSWPSDKQGMIVHDVRLKAARADAQSLYVAWLLQYHAYHRIPTTMIGYSFGCRVIGGSLHAIAGGQIAGRSLPGQPVTGMQINAGFVAPALEQNDLGPHGRYRRAPKNLDRLSLFFNHNDVALRQYWLIDRIRSNEALGFAGPKRFATRVDGSELIVRARDCAAAVGRRHNELNYYQRACRAGREMASLIDDATYQH